MYLFLIRTIAWIKENNIMTTQSMSPIGSTSTCFLTHRKICNRFEISEPLGSGKFSVVYIGIDQETDEKVVIKVLKPGKL